MGGEKIEACGGARPGDVVDGLRRYIREYAKSHSDALDCRRSKAMAMAGLRLFFFEWFCGKLNTCVGAWRRRHGVMERGWSMLMTTVTRSDMPFFR